MAVLHDKEFGDITVTRASRMRSVRIHVDTSGKLSIKAPLMTPLVYLRGVVASSRGDLRQLMDTQPKKITYQDGTIIGKTHTIAVIKTGMVDHPKVKVERKKLLVYLPTGHTLESRAVQQLIRDSVVAILRKEAKSYLNNRLSTLGEQLGLSYERIRFSHAGTRWGSCSSTGTISLNIGLMKLKDELIDYVIIHELCHTRHMNHSKAFWQLVGQYDPHYKLHRRQIARETPSV
ncbi:MAG: SprT family zinc-dependent metalloprotease [Candidatus Saccharimonas aalborgensis]